MSDLIKLKLRESMSHAQMDAEFEAVGERLKELEQAEKDLIAAKERIKELEQERGTFHQFRAEAVMMREMLLSKDVNAVDVSPNDLKEALAKRDLEQRLNTIDEIRDMKDSMHVGGQKWLVRVVDIENLRANLRKQAEDLPESQTFQFNDATPGKNHCGEDL